MIFYFDKHKKFILEINLFPILEILVAEGMEFRFS